MSTPRPRDGRIAFLALGVAIVALCWLASSGSGAVLAGGVAERLTINPPSPNPKPFLPEPVWVVPALVGGFAGTLVAPVCGAVVSVVYGAFALRRSGWIRVAGLGLAALGTVPLVVLGVLVALGLTVT